MANSRIGLNWPPLRVMSAKLLFRSFAPFQAKHEGVRPCVRVRPLKPRFVLASLSLFDTPLPPLSTNHLELTGHYPNQFLLCYCFNLSRSPSVAWSFFLSSWSGRQGTSSSSSSSDQKWAAAVRQKPNRETYCREAL